MVVIVVFLSGLAFGLHVCCTFPLLLRGLLPCIQHERGT